MVKNQLTSFFKTHGIFISLLLIGLIFRFLFIYYQGLSNDELSAWKRTEFTNWNDFWQLGVKAGDMHPVFYQALLWFWVRLFGDSEFSLRSTSLLFYLLNAWIIYRISIRFFSKQVGLSIIAVYAGLAFTIIHTVFARPYNSGTFFLLLLVWSIFEVQRSNKQFTTWYIGVIIGFLGAMLSHYYAFLTGSVIGFLAIFYVERHKIKGIIISGILAILLFLPHWPVTKFQLSQGGLGWLAAPKWNWLFDFFYQFFNFSWFIFVGFVLLFLYSFARAPYFKSAEDKFVLRIFVLTYLAGHLISLYYTPVLRELVMLFTLPFLLLYLFRGFQFSAGKHFNRGLVTISIILGVHSIYVMKLLQPVNFGVFREIGQTVNHYEPILKQKNIEYASSFNNVSYINYYYNKDVSEPISDWASAETVYALAERAKTSEKSYFIYNWSNHFHVPMYYEVIKRYFPFVKHHKVYFNSASSIFSKEKCVSGGMKKTLLSKDFKNLFPDSVTTTDEFIGGIFIPVKTLKAQKDAEYFVIEALGQMENASPLYFVVTAERDGKIIMNGENAAFYQAYDQSRLLSVGKPVTFFSAFTFPKDLLDTDVVHIYFWNPEKQLVRIKTADLFKICSNGEKINN